MCVPHEDAASFANFSDVIINHIDLALKVDFHSKQLKGSALLSLEALKSASKVILDSRGLIINGITGPDGTCNYKITDHGVLGHAITVDLAKEVKTGEKFLLEIAYSTSHMASALQFVDKEITEDKKQPFLYSQCQAIHARSIVPCMDTPAVKQTYAARVLVPHDITCLMSAIGYGKDEESNPQVVEWTKGGEYKNAFALHSREKRVIEEGYDAYLFKQPMRMPSYLLAIVAGGLEKRDISKRCAVWAEPSMVDKARWEFDDTETMLKTAEDLLGPYRWGRYDMVVLPPFFPFGGMENPCLTFVTPTIIAGDRSLTSVIAHEIAHSWTGNLVTNANWEHFWLNEGFTVFCERKIMGRIYGESIRQFKNICGWEDRMLPTIKETFNPNHEFTKLCPVLRGIDPDDSYSTIPYEKGSALLLVLEQKLNDSPRFEQFLRDYIAKFAGKSIVTQDWKDYLFEYFNDQKSILEQIQWHAWFYEPGVPPQVPTFEEEGIKECRNIAKVWTSGTDAEVDALDAAQFKAMDSEMKVKVLDCIETFEEPLSHDRIEKLEKKYQLTASQNCEIFFSLCLIALKAKYSKLVPFMMKFVTEQGRLKYVKPIFAKLFAWEETREKAIIKFEKNKPYMHPITVEVISRLLIKPT